MFEMRKNCSVLNASIFELFEYSSQHLGPENFLNVFENALQFLVIDSHGKDFLEGIPELDVTVSSLDLVAEKSHRGTLHRRIEPICENCLFLVILAQL